MNSFPPAPPLDRVTTYDSFLNERERNWKIVVPNWLGYTLSRGLVWLHSRGLEKSVACYTVSIPIYSYSNSHVFYIALGKFVVENNNEILPTGTMYVLCTYSSCLSLSLLNQKWAMIAIMSQKEVNSFDYLINAETVNVTSQSSKMHCIESWWRHTPTGYVCLVSFEFGGEKKDYLTSRGVPWINGDTEGQCAQGLGTLILTVPP